MSERYPKLVLIEVDIDDQPCVLFEYMLDSETGFKFSTLSECRDDIATMFKIMMLSRGWTWAAIDVCNAPWTATKISKKGFNAEESWNILQALLDSAAEAIESKVTNPTHKVVSTLLKSARQSMSTAVDVARDTQDFSVTRLRAESVRMQAIKEHRSLPDRDGAQARLVETVMNTADIILQSRDWIPGTGIKLGSE